MQDISRHERFFKTFFENWLEREREDREPLRLKYEHSLKVLAHARLLAASEEFAAAARRSSLPLDLLRRAALLAALYHDLARFPQFFRWRTFVDGLSTDHGRLGVKTLKEEKALAEESSHVRKLTQSAVILHNRHRLPARLPADARLISEVVRDADKLDICRVFAEQLVEGGPRSPVALLRVRDDPALYAPKVLEDALARRVASYGDLRSVNDFRVLLGTWQYDLRFAVSRRKLAEEGNLRALLEGAPLPAPLRPARDRLLADLRRALED
jgi:hypothetical protein